MAYNEVLADRINSILAELELPKFEDKKMFGGVGFLLNGNMACGVHKRFLVVRVGPDNYEQALDKKATRPFDITGRAMKGWVMVDEEGFDVQEDLKDWVKMGIDFALTLPPK